jgi:hypothetical protein
VFHARAYALANVGKGSRGLATIGLPWLRRSFGRSGVRSDRIVQPARSKDGLNALAHCSLGFTRTFHDQQGSRGIWDGLFFALRPRSIQKSDHECHLLARAQECLGECSVRGVVPKGRHGAISEAPPPLHLALRVARIAATAFCPVIRSIRLQSPRRPAHRSA